MSLCTPENSAIYIYICTQQLSVIIIAETQNLRKRSPFERTMGPSTKPALPQTPSSSCPAQETPLHVCGMWRSEPTLWYTGATAVLCGTWTAGECRQVLWDVGNRTSTLVNRTNTLIYWGHSGPVWAGYDSNFFPHLPCRASRWIFYWPEWQN